MYFNNLSKWIVNDESLKNVEAVQRISKELSVSIPTAKLLYNRGCTSTELAKRFIGKEEEQLYDPFLLKDMDKAASRIADAVSAEERIVIYGDYDVDGVTSVSSLYLYLKSYGADVSYHIPCRMTEGYGMSKAVIDKLREEGCELIVTVDTGITAVSEIAHAKSIGIDVVVTDHHECHEILPEADAIVNPCRPDCEYPFKELAGVGVVFKLICAVEKLLNPEDSLGVCVRRISKEYCDLVALGTIADVMPVKDENRLIVSYGLSLIERGTRPAITELINASGSESKYSTKKKITAAFVGFTLAPRINAAGRIKDASIAVELLISDDVEVAKKLAKELCAINKLRQQKENAITEEAYAKIAAEHDFENDRVIVLDHEEWHHGIIGIVSSRITEKYGLPSILVSFDGEKSHGISSDDMGKGSGRSIKGVNLVDALSYCSDVLEKYGGHELAAGLSVKRENLPAFKRKINEYVRDHSDTEGSSVIIEAECVLDPDDITMSLVNELYYLEPFGTSNPVPVFRSDSLYVSEIIPIGGGKHVKLMLRRGNMVICAMCFRRSLADLDIYSGDVVDVLYTLDVNEFQGTKTLQMIVRDVRLSEKQLSCEIREHEVYDALAAGNGDFAITDEERASAVPTRDEFGVVYNILKKELRVEHEVFSIRALAHLIRSLGYNIPYVKLKFIIMIFRELNLIGVEDVDTEREIYSFKFIYVKSKTNLEKSNILKRLRSVTRSGETL